MKALFETIYKDNAWSNGSGAGSTKEYCAPLVSFLCGYIRGSEAKVICDIGCGDMQWMPDVIRQTGVSYIGVDCVRSVIEANVAARYGDRYPLSLFRPERLMSWETKVLLRLRPRDNE